VFDLHGVGQYAAAVDQQLRPAADHGRDAVRRVLLTIFSVCLDLFYAYLDPRIRPA